MNQLRDDLQNLIDGRFGGRIEPGFEKELSVGLAVAFDKLVCYDPPVHQKLVWHHYDYDAWLAADPAEPLDAFRTDGMRHLYKLEDGVSDALDRELARGSTLIDALYRVRINLIGKLVGDRVFCYRRMTAEAERRDHKAAVDSAHANLAARN